MKEEKIKDTIEQIKMFNQVLNELSKDGYPVLKVKIELAKLERRIKDEGRRVFKGTKKKAKRVSKRK